MGDQLLASFRVAWLQSRALCRVQESSGIYALSNPYRITPEAAAGCDLLN